MRITRIVLVIFGVLLFLIGLCLLIRVQWFEKIWLWPKAPWQAFVFMASAFWASAFGYFICAYLGKWRPLRNFALSALVGFGGSALYALHASSQSTATSDSLRLYSWGIFFLLSTLLNIVFFMISYPHGFIRTERIPHVLRWILGIVVIINLGVSLKLVAGINEFAWNLTYEMTIIYGWILTGAAVLAVLGCMEDFWENQWPIFGAFIGYDLVLIGPLFYMLFRAASEGIVLYRLIGYLGLVLVSLVAVIYYSIYYWRRFKNRSNY